MGKPSKGLVVVIATGVVAAALAPAHSNPATGG